MSSTNFPIPVLIEKLRIDSFTPTTANSQDVGYDVFSLHNQLIEPGCICKFPLGFRLEIPEDYEIQVRSRSGLASKGIIVVNQPGTIDPGYRGELAVLLTNISNVPENISYGQKIAQLVIKPRYKINFIEGAVQTETDRGESGFGSSQPTHTTSNKSAPQICS